MKKRVCMLVVVMFALQMFTFAKAPDYSPQAEQLNVFGLFKGTGQGFDLERQPTRAEGAVMPTKNKLRRHLRQMMPL